MGLREQKPVTPGRRNAILPDYKDVTKKEPERSLVKPAKKTGGRNAQGRVTTRFRGGEGKRKYRIIDFRRDKHGVPARVVAVEYDPNRTARIALLQYADGEKRYILAPVGLRVGDRVVAGTDVEVRPGNATYLRLMPAGTQVHNLELLPGKGGQLVRSAGASAQVLTREDELVLVRLPSGEVRRFHGDCFATVGQLSNVEHKNVVLGKAGKTRYKGRRPRVRGTAMDPRSHPHGGGEGRSGEGMPTAKTPWGKPARGVKTRKPKKPSDGFILSRRRK